MDNRHTEPAVPPGDVVAPDHLLPPGERNGDAGSARPTAAAPAPAAAPAGAPDAEAFGSPDNKGKTRRPRRTWLLPVVLVVLGIGLIAGIIYYLYARQFEDTDDAFLDAHIATISPRIDGHVIRVLVNDNELVKKDQPLVEFDPATLDTDVEQAQANLDEAIAKRNQSETQLDLIKKTAAAAKEQAQAGVTAAQAGVDTAQAGIAQAGAQLDADKANAHKSELDLTRFKNLLTTGDVTQQQVDAAVADDATARAKVAASEKGVASAKAQLAEAKAKVAEAQGQYAEVNVVPERTAVSERDVNSADASISQLKAALDQAKLMRSYATITAPFDGRITKRSVEPGNYVEKGQPFFSLIPKDLFVTANFKETQLKNMQPNQAVEIKIDAYPNLVLKGHIDSLQEGTGSRFSMIPPENATGNYVKVVQRVPVKIVFDDPLDEKYDFAPGMSVEPSVRIK
jgi:membrane fusion protein (multidrug efflux system)